MTLESKIALRLATEADIRALHPLIEPEVRGGAIGAEPERGAKQLAQPPWSRWDVIACSQ
jgi:hypothetical protein